MFSVKLLVVLATVATAASAAAVRAADEVFSPTITAPHAGDQWTVGSIQTITWDTSSIPSANQNQSGLILLGYIEDGQIDEHLDIGTCLMSMSWISRMQLICIDRTPTGIELSHHGRSR